MAELIELVDDQRRSDKGGVGFNHVRDDIAHRVFQLSGIGHRGVAAAAGAGDVLQPAAREGKADGMRADVLVPGLRRLHIESGIVHGAHEIFDALLTVAQGRGPGGIIGIDGPLVQADLGPAAGKSAHQGLDLIGRETRRILHGRVRDIGLAVGQQHDMAAAAGAVDRADVGGTGAHGVDALCAAGLGIEIVLAASRRAIEGVSARHQGLRRRDTGVTKGPAIDPRAPSRCAVVGVAARVIQRRLVQRVLDRGLALVVQIADQLFHDIANLAAAQAAAIVRERDHKARRLRRIAVEGCGAAPVAPRAQHL